MHCVAICKQSGDDMQDEDMYDMDVKLKYFDVNFLRVKLEEVLQDILQARRAVNQCSEVCLTMRPSTRHDHQRGQREVKEIKLGRYNDLLRDRQFFEARLKVAEQDVLSYNCLHDFPVGELLAFSHHLLYRKELALYHKRVLELSGKALYKRLNLSNSRLTPRATRQMIADERSRSKSITAVCDSVFCYVDKQLPILMTVLHDRQLALEPPEPVSLWRFQNADVRSIWE